MGAAEPGLAPVHPVQRPRPTPACLARAGVDVDLSVDLVVLACLGNLGPGSGKPRAAGAVGDPAACADSTKPAHVFRRGLGEGVGGFRVCGWYTSSTVGEVRTRSVFPGIENQKCPQQQPAVPRNATTLQNLLVV